MMLSKAFDIVPIRRLLGKLEFYGINGPILKWIVSFLTERTQSVLLCDGERSDSEKVLSGVPQGTVLAPLLFLLHINELPAVVDPHTRCRLFADDCLLGMQFNASKCHVMSISRQVPQHRLHYNM